MLELDKSGAPQPRSVSIVCVVATYAAIAPPVKATFTVTVAVVRAEGSPHVHVYRQGRYSKVVDFFISVIDAAIGWRRAKKRKEMWKTLH